MKTFLYRLRTRFRGYGLPLTLNIIGMAIAFVAAIVILVQVRFDMTYDMFHKNADRIYRLHMIYPTEVADSVGRTRTLAVPFVRELLKAEGETLIETVSYSVLKAGHRTWHGSKADFALPYFLVDSCFVDIFTFDLVSGCPDDFNGRTGAVLIPESIAVKQFGDTDVVGKVLSQSDSDTLRICGVYKDFPSNSMLKNYVYMPHRNMSVDENNWNRWVYEVYIEVKPGVSLKRLTDFLGENLERVKNDFGEISPLDMKGWQVEPVLIHDLHYLSEIVEFNVPVVTKEIVMLLFVISLVIVIIAGFNFANFQVALIPRRIKNININRILGAGRNRLLWGILSESVAYVIVSWIGALLVLVLFADEWLFGTSIVRVSFEDSLSVLGYTFLMAIIIGVLIGAYPAFYLTRVPAQIMLKRHLGLTRKSLAFQDVLLCFQFLCSLALVTCSYVMLQQNRYLYDGGTVDKEHLAFAYMKDTIPDAAPLYEKINAIEGVKGAALSLKILTAQDEFMAWSWEHVVINVMQVSENYHQVMGIDMVEGRNFCEKDSYAMIFNETAKLKYPDYVAVGKRFGSWGEFEGFEIVGICKDVNFMSLRKEIAPMAFILAGEDNLTCVNVRLDEGFRFEDVKEELEEALDVVDTGYKHNFRSFDEIYSSTYRYENLMTNRIALLALVAILISVMGLCGQVLMNGEYRLKEFAVKRVMGAGICRILREQLQRYLYLLCIAAILGAPVYKYFVGSRWLVGFYYHIDFSWSVYVVSVILIACTVVLITILFMLQYLYKNPVEILKYE